jgi:serine/threonine-protein kinase RsbT
VTTQILATYPMKIDAEEDVVLVRRKVRSLAEKRGFDAFATAAVTTATSEITRNVWVHARKGSVVIEEITDGVRSAIRLEFQDEGPGIADLERALAGGHSTARSLGVGLSGSRRLVDEFEIETEVGRGTRVKMTKWTRY